MAKHRLFKRNRIVGWKAGLNIYIGKVVDSNIRDEIYPQLIVGSLVKFIPAYNNKGIMKVTAEDSRITQNVKIYDLFLPNPEDKKLYRKHRD